MKYIFILYILFLCYQILRDKNCLGWYCIGVCTLSNTFHILGLHSQFLLSLCLFLRLCISSDFKNPLYINPLRLSIIIWIICVFFVSIFDYHDNPLQKITAAFREQVCTVFIIISSYYFINKTNSIRSFEYSLILCLILLSTFALFQLITGVNITQEIAIDNFSSDSSYTSADMYTAKEYQDSLGRMRIGSLLGFAFDYGYYSGVLGLFSVYLYFRDNKIFYLVIGILCGFGGALLSGSRSVLLSVLGGYMFFFLIRSRLNVRKILILAVSIICFFFFFKELAVIQGFIDLFTSGGDNSVGSSRDMRTDQLVGSLYWFQQSPIFGNGYGFIENAAPDNAMKAMVMGSESLLFSILIQSGILGFIYWFVFIFQLVLFYVNKIVDARCQFGFALLISFLLYSFATGVQGSIFITFPLIAYSLKKYKFHSLAYKFLNMKINSNISQFLIRSLRHILRKSEYTENYVQYRGQIGNNIVRECVLEAFEEKKGLMIAKFGTIELKSVVGCKLESLRFNKVLFSELLCDYINVMPQDRLNSLCKNAGFFPNDLTLQKRFAELMMSDIKYLDILGSSCYEEKYLWDDIKNIKRIEINSYLAPFLWEKPWTSVLKGKKVLVVHPFEKSIVQQYAKRKELFEDPMVLPEFKELQTIKAVQSIAGEKTSFCNWFEALDYMKSEIDKRDFDVAIIGCGAYGFPLAAHVKRSGKVAIHMAGWTQMLFGIYGKRWLEDQSGFSKYINDYWIRPSESEKPNNAYAVEGGCYW